MTLHGKTSPPPPSSTTTTWLGIRSSFQSLIAIIVAFIIACIVYMTQNGGDYNNNEIMGLEDEKLVSRCNVFSGKWVFDDENFPLYKEKKCTYMSDQLACEKFGRKDFSYQNWRWQPHHCDLPRFNATKLLERLRNKRMVYIGDSLNRNQWVSMVCLIDSIISDPDLKSMQQKYNSSLNIFKSIEYNATIEFYWEPLLVESNSDNPVNHRVPDRIVRVKAIEKHARHWTDADILVFNSYLWWRRSNMTALWGSFERGDEGTYKSIKMPRVYEMALETWSDWLEIHIDRNRTRMFFMSPSPTHQKANEWGGIKGETCYNETELILRQGYETRTTRPEMMWTVENVLGRLRARGVNVEFMNITQLTEYRKEGHPSIYRKQWEPLTEQQLSNPHSYSDCIHWCLPGVPDVWNQLLFAYIV